MESGSSPALIIPGLQGGRLKEMQLAKIVKLKVGLGKV
ncbi:hypothetical protein FHS90_000404 [Rufibacter quisquiliarum]|uniref:Uncharacterized protein n=1 Tax=Rufibacter quisquiliarum TaxID=1549639 RepID=A0A839GL86_9BACT|nr:hypothetical protein [Rufibacter quisquiliarum]